MASITSTKPCSDCNQTLDQSAYSNAQWKKGAAKTCKSCLAVVADATGGKGGGESKKPEKKLAKPVVDEIKAGVQERRVSRRKSFLEKQAKEQAAIEKAKAERVRMKSTATEMFMSEGVDTVPFSYE